MLARNAKPETDAADVIGESGALVLGGDVNGLGVIRSLGRLHVSVGAVLSIGPGEHAHHSRYVSVTEEVREDAGDRELIKALKAAALRLGKERVVLIPTSDRYSQFLSKNAHQLPSEFILNCANAELYDAFLDKWNTARLCEKHSVLAPQTYCPTTFDEVEQAAASLTFPVIVKPRYTFDSRFPGKNAQFSNTSQFIDFFEQHSLLGAVVAQEIIPSGDGDIIVLSSYSNSRGRVLAMYSGRKLRQYLPDYGATCYGISERHEALEQKTRQFLDEIAYRGFAMIEFARSREDGRAYFLELNTRTSWTNQLYVDSGVDLTRIGYLDMTGIDSCEDTGPVEQRNGVLFLDFRRDIASMQIKRRRGEIHFLAWFISVLKARSFAFWDVNDPMPFVAACVFRLKHLARRLLGIFRFES
jgi:predicted ATP-grasp superfamily ATP-dependent carboligase